MPPPPPLLLLLLLLRLGSCLHRGYYAAAAAAAAATLGDVITLSHMALVPTAICCVPRSRRRPVSSLLSCLPSPHSDTSHDTAQRGEIKWTKMK